MERRQEADTMQSVPKNGMIYDPVTIKRGSTVQDALDIMAEYKIGGIPVGR